MGKSAAKVKQRDAGVDETEIAKLVKEAQTVWVSRDRHPIVVPLTSKRTPEIEAVFLLGLAKGYSVTTAALAVKIGRRTVFDWRQASEATLDPETGIYADDFCVRWEAAVAAGVELLEDEAHRRAFHGFERPVYQKGELVGQETVYSDTLMQLLLKGKAPRKYADRTEHTGKDGGPVLQSVQVEFVPFEGKK